MFRAAKTALATSQTLRPPGRTLHVYEDDTFILSYPRSGNTWLRFLIASLVSGSDDVDFLNIERLIPDIYQNSALRLRLMQRPRILKSHEHFNSRYQHIVYIVRDPRDVLMSLFNYQITMNQIDELYSLDSYGRQFLRGDVPFGSWREHVDGWVSAWHGQDNFLLLRYEDLHREPAAQLARLAEFLGLARNPDAIESAIARCTAATMRTLEANQWRRSKVLKTKRPDRPFVGPATTGHWRRQLSSSLAGSLEETWQSTMTQLGYQGHR